MLMRHCLENPPQNRSGTDPYLTQPRPGQRQAVHDEIEQLSAKLEGFAMNLNARHTDPVLLCILRPSIVIKDVNLYARAGVACVCPACRGLRDTHTPLCDKRDTLHIKHGYNSNADSLHNKHCILRILCIYSLLFSALYANSVLIV